MPSDLGKLPPVLATLENSLRAELIFKHLERATVNLEQQRQIRVYHNFLIERSG